MALWIPNATEDSVPCFVSGLPRSPHPDPGFNGPLVGPSANPARYPGAWDIEGTRGFGYMHYCTRMLIYRDVDISDGITVSESPDVYKTERFGDLGGYFMRKPQGEGWSAVVKEGRSDPSSVFLRYRFPSEMVAYCYYDSRGVFANEEYPFEGKTCGWVPGESTSFFWEPGVSELSEIGDAITPSLSSLSPLDQSWGMVIIAWMWAGWNHGSRRPPSPKQGLKSHPVHTDDLREVEECDIFYLAYLF